VVIQVKTRQRRYGLDKVKPAVDKMAIDLRKGRKTGSLPSSGLCGDRASFADDYRI
jgi:hypothetical protein